MLVGFWWITNTVLHWNLSYREAIPVVHGICTYNTNCCTGQCLGLFFLTYIRCIAARNSSGQCSCKDINRSRDQVSNIKYMAKKTEEIWDIRKILVLLTRVLYIVTKICNCVNWFIFKVLVDEVYRLL